MAGMPRLPPGNLEVGIDMDSIHRKETAIKAPDDWGAIDVSDKEHARIIKKLDWHILPPISLLYFLSFLDRVNIANARIAGMSTDLNLIGLRYNIVSAIFFVPYCLAQVPSNIVLKVVRPSRWLPAIMVVWGTVATLTCLVKTYDELIVVRVFLGLAEAGLFPGLAYYVSLWYPRSERAKGIALFISASIMGGAFAGLLAYGIIKMEGVGGLRGWQWIFCLEGLVTVVVALAAPFFMYDDPASASFLTEDERRYVVDLLKRDAQGLATHYDSKFVLQAFKDYKIYVQFALYIGLLIPAYGFALFIPTIINDLGYSAANAQLLSVPPFVAGCICTVTSAIYSDRRRLRGPFVICGALVAIIGYVVLYTQTRPGIAYSGTVLVAMGLYPTIPIDLTWISSNAGGEIKRGVALAMVNGFGNLGGICASFIFFDPPRFHIGLETIMACLCIAILLSLFMMWDCHRQNRQREWMCRERGISEVDRGEFKESGDNSPLFRFTL